ncbi:DUF724 domain-containing protein 6 isoform X3 [Amaranthus tricolor]|uniref:DUF724 domain-containing protein 6 isoform X3 n=1 Tax=Amaranthus tricolor TaxID=29722 RepID=UPI00258E56CF|nr:DUF724 domain-containing protein 6 isoform X3 [Amaranthus tricolor]
MEWNNGNWIYSSQDTSGTSNFEKSLNLVLNNYNEEKTRVPDVAKNNVPSNNIPTISGKSGQKEFQTPGNETVNSSSIAPNDKRPEQTSAHGDANLFRSSGRSNEEHGTSANVNSTAPDDALPPKLKQSKEISHPSDLLEIKDYEKQSTPRKRGRPPKIKILSSENSLEDFIVQFPSCHVDNFGPRVIGLAHSGKVISPLGQRSSQRLRLEQKKATENREQNVDVHESVVSNESGMQKEGEVTNLKRKRGRPFKVRSQLDSPKAKEAVEEPDSITEPVPTAEPCGTTDSTPPELCINRMMNMNDQVKRLSDIHSHNLGITSKSQERKQRKISIGSFMPDLNEPVKHVILKKVMEQKSTQQVEPQTEDNSGIRAIEDLNNGVVRDVDGLVTGTSSKASDDEAPLLALFEGTHSLLTTDSRISTGASADECNESGGRDHTKTAPAGQRNEKEQDKRECNGIQLQDKNIIGRPDEAPIQSESTAILPVEECNLPFVKDSVLWKMIENMEVLKRIPQKPHFHPLYNCKEECREGLAIGSMVTFTSLVERISKACFNDPKSHLDGYLEALVDLEELGFNVAPVRENLNTMISIKSRFEQAQNTSREIESQIMERNLEKSTIKVELEDVDEKIAKLMETRALILSKKERKDAEITLLQTSIDSIKVTLESPEKEFEKVKASLW